MVEIEIGANEKGQRFDRFLRKYLKGAPLSFIYKTIRKDAKVNMKREKDDYCLKEGDVIQLYLPEEEIAGFRRQEAPKRYRKTFSIAYEDENVLIADKPAGLLTHGDRNEKSDHLANQVQGYLMSKGDFDPAAEKTFAPSPANRIDRNTTGLVIFAKNYDALKRLNGYIRNRENIRKYYLTIVCGKIDSELTLEGSIAKDESRNVSRMVGSGQSQLGMAGQSQLRGSDQSQPGGSDGTYECGADHSRKAVTHVRPIRSGKADGIEVTLCEVEIETGRTHQIRVQLAEAGHPLAGDPKYGRPDVNKAFLKRFGLTHQLLTAYKLEFGDMDGEFPGVSGKVIEAHLPDVFRRIKGSIKGDSN